MSSCRVCALLQTSTQPWSKRQSGLMMLNRMHTLAYNSPQRKMLSQLLSAVDSGGQLEARSNTQPRLPPALL